MKIDFKQAAVTMVVVMASLAIYDQVVAPMLDKKVA